MSRGATFAALHSSVGRARLRRGGLSFNAASTESAVRGPSTASLDAGIEWPGLVVAAERSSVGPIMMMMRGDSRPLQGPYGPGAYSVTTAAPCTAASLSASLPSGNNSGKISPMNQRLLDQVRDDIQGARGSQELGRNHSSIISCICSQY